MRLGNVIITRARPEPPALQCSQVNELYEDKRRSGKTLVLGVLSARSGTRWLCDIFSHHVNASGVTERNAGAEAYWRFIKYNHLPVDTSGILRLIKHGIVDDWKHVDISLVFSPYFSHGFLELVDALRPARVILAVSEPESTVQSLYNKGFFKDPYFRSRTDHAIGYQPALLDRWSHLFGRIVPNGEFYTTWEALTRVGKIAWWGNRINVDIHDQIKTIPPQQIMIFNLQEADQNYEYYQKMSRDFGLEPPLSRKRFLAIKKRTTRPSDNVKHVWSKRERDEFTEYAAEWSTLYKTLCARPYATTRPERFGRAGHLDQ